MKPFDFHKENGTYISTGSPHDLFMAPEKKTVYLVADYFGAIFLECFDSEIGAGLFAEQLKYKWDGAYKVLKVEIEV